MDPKLQFDTSALPISQLESLRFKANQIIESIQSLHAIIHGHPAAMPAWPDILSKYNVLLSQTHNFSNSLLPPPPPQNTRTNVAPVNPFEKVTLHPSMPMADTQLDTEVIPLLRNVQTSDVLRAENDTVRRLSEHMNTRGSVGVLSNGLQSASYEDVIRECTEIRDSHDRRVERAVRAVTMLREKFDWKQRVQVEVEEPEELTWDPRFGLPTLGEDEAGESDSSSSSEDDIEQQMDEVDSPSITMDVSMN